MRSQSVVRIRSMVAEPQEVEFWTFWLLQRGDWKCRSGKCDTDQNARVENAGVENAGVNSRDGKCRSRLAIRKAEPRLYSETALNYLLKIVLSSMQKAGIRTRGTGTCATGTALEGHAGLGHALLEQRHWDTCYWNSATGTCNSGTFLWYVFTKMVEILRWYAIIATKVESLREKRAIDDRTLSWYLTLLLLSKCCCCCFFAQWRVWDVMFRRCSLHGYDRARWMEFAIRRWWTCKKIFDSLQECKDAKDRDVCAHALGQTWCDARWRRPRSMTINLFGHLFEQLLGNSLGQLIEPVTRICTSSSSSSYFKTLVSKVFHKWHQLDVLWFQYFMWSHIFCCEWVGLKKSLMSLCMCVHVNGNVISMDLYHYQP